MAGVTLDPCPSHPGLVFSTHTPILRGWAFWPHALLDYVVSRSSLHMQGLASDLGTGYGLRCPVCVQSADRNPWPLQSLPDPAPPPPDPLWTHSCPPSLWLPQPDSPQNSTQTWLAQTCCSGATCSVSQAAHPGHPPLLVFHWHMGWEVIWEARHASLPEPLPKPSSWPVPTTGVGQATDARSGSWLAGWPPARLTAGRAFVLICPLDPEAETQLRRLGERRVQPCPVQTRSLKPREELGPVRAALTAWEPGAALGLPGQAGA